MIRVGEMRPGAIYRGTRRDGRANTYCTVMDPVKARRLASRLRARPVELLKAEQARVLRAIERGHVIIEMFIRYTDGQDKRVEKRLSRFGVAPTERAHVREVKKRPGYAAAREAA